MKMIKNVIRKDLQCNIEMMSDFKSSKLYSIAIQLQDDICKEGFIEDENTALQLVTNELREHYDKYRIYETFKVTFYWFIDKKCYTKEFMAD